MKKFNDFYISSNRIFWAINFGTAILIVILIGFLFNFKLNEILIQMAIAIVMTFLLIWILGGYSQIRLNYIKRQNKKSEP